MIDIILIGIGGGLGAISRHGLNLLAIKKLGLEAHHGTLLANVIGCLLIGIAWCLIDAGKLGSPRIKLLLITGFMGGLTTFSTFGHQTAELYYFRGMLSALFNIGMNLFLGLMSVGIGFYITSLWFPPREKLPEKVPAVSTVDDRESMIQQADEDSASSRH